MQSDTHQYKVKFQERRGSQWVDRTFSIKANHRFGEILKEMNRSPDVRNVTYSR